MGNRFFLLVSIFLFTSAYEARAEHFVAPIAPPIARQQAAVFGYDVAVVRQQILLSNPLMSVQQADFLARRFVAGGGFPQGIIVPPAYVGRVVAPVRVVRPAPVFLPPRRRR
jgi:hypothetical protein